MKSNKLLLYAVTDRYCIKNRTLTDAVEESLKGGVTCVQIREKNLDEDTFLKEAEKIKIMCRRYNVPFIVNDNADIAVKINADGVHVGQCDEEASEVRKRIGKNKILGVSAQTVEQAILAEKHGADYLGVGSIFPTNSKADAENVSIGTLKAICKAVSIPVVAIGGITAENANLLKNSGICGIAVISAIYADDNIKQAAENMLIAAKKAVSI